MTEQFASIELARLYESQGYLDDALAMYRTLIDEEGAEENLDEARDAVKRLEEKLWVPQADPAEPEAALDIPGMEAQADDRVPMSEQEEKMAALLEKWLMLMVVQKRVNVFKAIRGRL